MEEILKDESTGFVPEEELLSLAATAGGLDAAAQSGWGCVVTVFEVIVSASQAFGDGCPTTACTSRCGSSAA